MVSKNTNRQYERKVHKLAIQFAVKPTTVPNIKIKMSKDKPCQLIKNVWMLLRRYNELGQVRLTSFT